MDKFLLDIMENFCTIDHLISLSVSGIFDIFHIESIYVSLFAKLITIFVYVQ